MSILYEVTLEVAYRYDSPVAANRSLLRIQPLATAEQQVISGLVTADPLPSFRRDGRDFFGNQTVEFAHDARLTEISFRFSGRVRRELPVGGLDLSCPLDQLPAELTAVRSVDPASPHHFLGRSERVGIEPEIVEFARRCTEPGMSAVAAVSAVAQSLHAEFAFDPEATDVTTEPLAAFRQRRGVCQDISHVMISALRGLGIPAGYVSGFLRTLPPEGQARLEGVDAMHAWVRAWCGREAGWIEIDPTNNMPAGPDHIAVAIGRDYADVAPLRGSLRGTGSHETTHTVDVVAVS